MMTHCERYAGAIHDMLDGTLGPIRRSELQIHLDQCGGCRALLQDLERIRDVAAALDPPAPPDRVWLQVAGRLRQEGRLHAPVVPAGPTRGYYTILAIAAALVLAVGASLLVLLPTVRGSRQPSVGAATGHPAQGNAATAERVQGDIESEFRLAEQHYQAAIGKLEEAAKSDQSSIDPHTAATLQKNLQVIDQAIAESRAAFRGAPYSAPARDSLFQALKHKVSLLQDTIALMNEMRKGNAAGAAQLVDGINKG